MNPPQVYMCSPSCTPVFLPGESHGRRSLVGYSPWGCKESDTTELQILVPNLVLKFIFILMKCDSVSCRFSGALPEILPCCLTGSVGSHDVWWRVIVVIYSCVSCPPPICSPHNSHWTKNANLIISFPSLTLQSVLYFYNKTWKPYHVLLGFAWSDPSSRTPNTLTCFCCSLMGLAAPRLSGPTARVFTVQNVFPLVISYSPTRSQFASPPSWLLTRLLHLSLPH